MSTNGTTRRQPWIGNPTLRAAGGAALAILALSVAVVVVKGIRAVPTVLIVVTFFGALTFCGVYLRRHWRTPVGYNLMALGVVMLIETSLGILGILFGSNWPGRDYIRAGAWALVAFVLWWRVGLLYTLGLGRPVTVPAVPDGTCPCCLRPLPDGPDYQPGSVL